MRGLQGGVLVLLALPFVAYGAWQINGVTRTDLIASEPPAETGPTREQLAATRAKTEAAARETHKAAEVTWRYRAAGPGDAVKDTAASEVVKAADARSADLNDLEKFLSGTEKPTFIGSLKDRFEKWQVERVALRDDEEAAKDWIKNPPPVHSAADADKAMAAVDAIIKRYSGRRFADRAKALDWRLLARLYAIGELTKLADEQYPNATRVSLPIEPDNNAVATAVTTLKGLKAQISGLNKDVSQAAVDKLKIDTAVLAAVEAKGAVFDEYSAREKLLSLFTQDPLYTSGDEVSGWLKQVADQYDATKDEKVRELIRRKVQEFCDAFVPESALLDELVVLEGEREPVQRDKVEVYHDKDRPGGKTMQVKLGREAGSEFTEFNVEKKLGKLNGRLSYAGKAYDLSQLKPTELSKTAKEFNDERKRLADGTTVRKWTAKSVEELKKKCEAQSKSVDLLQVTARRKTITPGILTRLRGLAKGMAAYPKLFDVTQ